jgi:NH3-dependent NAD+ synthetase
MMLSLARHERAWVVGPRNRTEDALGTYSLASRAATFFPIVGLWKSEVMELCAAAGVPGEIIRSTYQPPAADCVKLKGLADLPLALIDRILAVEVGDRPQSSLADVDPRAVQVVRDARAKYAFKQRLPLRQSE